MGIVSRVSAVMANTNVIAISLAIPARVYHSSIAHRSDWGAVSRGVVNGHMAGGKSFEFGNIARASGKT